MVERVKNTQALKERNKEMEEILVSLKIPTTEMVTLKIDLMRPIERVSLPIA